MLAAILPEGDRAWFFKVTGPVADVTTHAAEIGSFLASIKPAAGQPHPAWQLPSSWQEQSAAGMRAATLLIPNEPKPLELSVTVLPWSGGAGELLGNVNRWRGQLQLAPTDAKGLAESSKDIQVGDATMTIVDLRGQMTGGMTPPFAGGPMASTPPVTAAAPSANTATNLPPGHPAVGPQSSPNATPFTFDAPTGWQSRPAAGMRKVDFLIDQDGKTAVMTAIDFPASAGPMMADPVANLNRWRREVGLVELSPADAAKAMQPLEIDGGEAMFMAILPDANQPGESEADHGTLAAMLRRGDTIWFFKVIGDAQVVAQERDNFESFLKSVRFTENGGTNDGNE